MMRSFRVVVCLVAGVLAVATVASPAIAAGETAVRVTVPPGIPEDQPTVGENVTVRVLVSEAPDGVGSYDVTVSLDDAETVRVVDATARGEPRSSVTDVTAESATVAAIGADTRNGASVAVAEVVLRVVAPGTADVSVSVDGLGDEAGRPYTVTGTSGTTIVAKSGEAPDVTGDGNPATDPDGDGRYEDVNGDGDATPGDATVLFNAVFEDDPAVTTNVALFDFNGDGGLTPGDATVLFDETF